MVAIFFISLFVFMFLSVPIAFSLGLASTLGIFLHETLPLSVVPQRIIVSLNSFPLMAIPFFILAGTLMQIGGLAKRLVNFGMALVGHVTGGLAMAVVLTSMFFAAISGSGTATTAAIGTIMIPAMIAMGYSKEYSSANQAVAGALGVILPPSIPMILYGVAAEVSIGDIFLAGILPGLLVTLSLLITAYIVSKKRGYVGVQKSTFKELVISFKEAILALLMPGIVLGGIYTGIFTPTEASVIAVAYALIVGMLVYREITLSKLADALQSSAIMTAMVMIVIGTAGLFGFFVTIMGVPNMIEQYMSAITTNQIVFLFIINVILLIAGMFLEGAAAILIFVPLFLPVAVSMGIDPVHFGIIMVVNLAIGLVTPPVGLDLFVVAKISKVSFSRLSRAVIPFVIILFVDVLIISYLPFLSTWIPSLMK